MKTTLYILALLVAGNSFSQSAASLREFDAKALQINKRGMIVLASWSTVNIGTGLIARSQTTGSTRYFHEMNALWNTVNLGLSVGSLIGSRKEQPFGFSQSLSRQQRLEKTFLINGALDLTYMAAGAWFIERAGNDPKNAERFDGYGKSLVLQGGFLLLFDGCMYYFHHRNGKKLVPFTENINLSMTGNGVGMVWHLD